MVEDGSDNTTTPAELPALDHAAFRVDAGAEWTVYVAGELDAESAARLRTMLSEAFDSTPEAVVVDLAELEFVDSVGLSVLVAGHNRAEALGTRFTVREVSPACRRVFEITQLDQVFGLS